jgi:hypothetical protein
VLWIRSNIAGLFPPPAEGSNASVRRGHEDRTGKRIYWMCDSYDINSGREGFEPGLSLTPDLGQAAFC